LNPYRFQKGTKNTGTSIDAGINLQMMGASRPALLLQYQFYGLQRVQRKDLCLIWCKRLIPKECKKFEFRPLWGAKQPNGLLLNEIGHFMLHALPK